MKHHKLLNAKQCAAELNVSVSSLIDLINFTGGDVHISPTVFSKAKDIAHHHEHCNILNYTSENSKNIGTTVERTLKEILNFNDSSTIHYDATTQIKEKNLKIEIKTITALRSTKSGSFESFMERGLYIKNITIEEITSGIFQHTKPLEFDVLIGVIVFMDGILIYMINADDINPIVGDVNSYQVTMGAQQKGHETEGTLTPNQLNLVAVIQGTAITDIELTYEALMDALKNNTVIGQKNEDLIIKSYDRMNDFVSFV